MIFKILFSVAVSFFFIYFVFTDINISEVRSSLLYTNSFDVVLAAVAISTFYLMRAYRWTILLGNNVSYADAFFASCIAYFFSLILIFQAGELSKIQFLKKKYNISRGFTASTIIIERMLDVSTLIIFFFISLVYYSIDSENIVYLLGTLGVISLIFLTFSKYFFSKARGTYLHKKIHSLLIKTKLGMYLIELYQNLNSAFILMHDNRLKMIIYIFILWSVNYCSVIVFLGRHGNFYEIIGGFSILSLGVAAQITPANIGQYEFIWTEIFKGIVPISVEQLIASGIVLHSVIIATITMFALVSWIFIRNE